MSPPIDTEIRVAQCSRCKAYVFACDASGLRTSADPAPLDGDAYRAALIAGRDTYDVIPGHDGRPRRLALRTPLTASSDCVIVAAHPCGSATLAVKAAPVPPQAPAPATAASAGADLAPEPATPVILPVSDDDAMRLIKWRPAICTECRVFFTDTEKADHLYNAWYISASQWWACHSEGCPRPVPRGTVTAGPRVMNTKRGRRS